MRAWWATLFVAGFLLLGMQSQGTYAATPIPGVNDNPCYYAEQLLEKGQQDKALAEFERLAAKNVTCAVDKYFTTAATVEAEANAAATEVAKQTPQPIPTQFLPASVLDARGFETEAQAAYQKAIEANPGITPPESLNHLDKDYKNDGTGNKAWGFLKDWSERIGATASEISTWLKSLGGLLAAALLLWLAWKYWRSGKQETTIDIVPFETGASGSDIGPAMAEAVQLAYEKTKNSKFEASSAKLVSDAAAEKVTKVPSELTGSEPAGLALTIYNWVRERRSKSYLLKGTLITDPSRGAGIIASLESDNQVIESETIWFSDYFGVKSVDEKDGPGAQDYLAMTETVAIWLYSVMASEEPAPADQQPTPSTGHYSTLWSSWSSYALFRNSLLALAWGNDGESAGLLHRSLSKDPTFLPARMNLATIQVQSRAGKEIADEEKRQQIFDKYHSILKDLWDRGGIRDATSGPDALMGSKLLFNYLAAKDYVAGWDDPIESDEMDDLLVRLSGVISNAKTSKDPDLNEMVVPLKLLHDTLKVRFCPTERADYLRRHQERFEDLVKSSAVFGLRAYYGNACFCAAAHHFSPNETDTNGDSWAARALAHLQASIEISPATKEWAPSDPSLEPLWASSLYGVEFCELVKENPKEPDKPTRTEHLIIFEKGTEEERALRELGTIAGGTSITGSRAQEMLEGF